PRRRRICRTPNTAAVGQPMPTLAMRRNAIATAYSRSREGGSASSTIVRGRTMPSVMLLDICGRRRSPATLSSFHHGRPPRNKGQQYPADLPSVEEIIAVMHAAGRDADAVRLRGLIVVLWRPGLRISEALALRESDLDPN